MRHALLICVAFCTVHVAAADAPPVAVDHVRFHPAAGRSAAMVGGAFAGSNVSPTDGFHVLAEIKAEPKADGWTDLSFENKTPYRWVRYQAPPGSKGNVAEVEFYAGPRKLNGPGFGSTGGNWRAALDGKTDTFFNAQVVDGQFVGIDLGEQASTRRPQLTAKGEDRAARVVTLASPTPGATVRYTLDGTTPGLEGGMAYAAPIDVTATTTVVAVAFKEGLAPSPAAFATYQVGAPVVINSFHIGNSLTGNAARFPGFAKTAGIDSHFSSFLMGGALTAGLWKAKDGPEQAHWTKDYAAARHPLDHVTVQPRDFDLDAEVDHELKFFDLVRERSPGVQPWLYAEWVERDRRRPSDRGVVPSYQMTKLYPALSWEESMSSMLLYVEEVQHRVNARDKGGKRARILPCSIALGLARALVDTGQFPGVAPGEASFYGAFFEDTVHVNAAGCYLVDLVWYAAFTGQSPEGKLLPLGTTLTAEQAKILQRLSWEIVKNYPDCGLFEEGPAPVSAPQFSPAAAAVDAPTPIRLASATPGASFRYTLDGTDPTRTRGYVYCGLITPRPGMTVKAIAFKSGMTDSPLAAATYAEKK